MITKKISNVILLILMNVIFIDQAQCLELVPPFSDSNVTLRQGWNYDKVNGGGKHHAIDYFLFDTNRVAKTFAVRAAASGVAARNTSTTWGKYIVIAHKDLINNNITHMTLYAHLANDSLLRRYPLSSEPVSNWKSVTEGEVIGNAGKTGKTGGDIHLHFIVFKGNSVSINSNRIDPYNVGGFSTSKKSKTRNDYIICDANHIWMNCPLVPSTYITNSGPFNIPDSGGSLNIPIIADTPGPIVRGDINVFLNHPRYEDLSITLNHANGLQGTIKSSGTALCGLNDNEPCDVFNIPLGKKWVGKDAFGGWNLNIEDLVAGAVGVSDDWNLFVTTHNPNIISPTQPPDISSNLPLVRKGSNVTLTYTLNGHTGCTIRGPGLNPVPVTNATGTLNVIIGNNASIYLLACNLGSDTVRIEVVPS